MANFDEALKWMREGHKVCRRFWKETFPLSYWKIDRRAALVGPTIVRENGQAANINSANIFGDDWEIYDESICCAEAERQFRLSGIIRDNSGISSICILDRWVNVRYCPFCGKSTAFTGFTSKSQEGSSGFSIQGYDPKSVI